MKRFLVILLIIQILLLTSCTLPFIGENAAPSGKPEDQQMLRVGENTAGNGLTGAAINSSPSALSSGSAILSTEGAILSEAPTGASIISSITTGAADSLSVPPYEAQATSVAGMDLTRPETNSSLPAASTPAGINTTPQNGEPAVTKRPVIVYYQDGDGCLIPMTRWIPQQYGIARAAVGFIIDSAIAREEVAYYGVYPVLPDNTSILGIDIKDGIASIDFNGYFVDYSSEASERNIVASVVYTLTEFKTISKVRFLVNGYPKDTLKYGTDVSKPLGRADIAINTSNSAWKSGAAKADVFLLKKANEGFTYMAPVSVPITDDSGLQSIPEILVRQLLQKGADRGMVTEIPQKTQLLKLDMLDGQLTLDFSSELLNYEGYSKEEGILKQLAYTVRQVDGIKRLRISVNGREAKLPEGTELTGGLAIPATINDVMDR